MSSKEKKPFEFESGDNGHSVRIRDGLPLDRVMLEFEMCDGGITRMARIELCRNGVKYALKCLREFEKHARKEKR